MRDLDSLALWTLGSPGLLRVDIVDSWTTWVQAGAAVFTAFALVIGGIWAYFRFRRDRTYIPRCSIDLDCSMAIVGPRLTLVVNVGITNCGVSNVMFKTDHIGRVEVSPINSHDWSRMPVGQFVEWRESDWRMRQDFFAHAQQRRKETGLEPGQDMHRACLFVMPADWVAAQVKCLLRLGADDKAPEWVATRVMVRAALDKPSPTVPQYNGLVERWIKR